jgi:hypothetical protein
MEQKKFPQFNLSVEHEMPQTWPTLQSAHINSIRQENFQKYIRIGGIRGQAFAPVRPDPTMELDQ